MPCRYDYIKDQLIIFDSELKLDLSWIGKLEKKKTETQETHYFQNRLHGPSRFFTSEWRPLSTSWFWHGKKTGVSKQFYPSGAYYSIQRYVDGVKTGLQQYFYEDQSPRTIESYLDGKLNGEVKLFWETGHLKRCTQFDRGIRHGWDRIWDEEGNLMDEGEYALANPVGAHRRWKNKLLIEEMLHLDSKRSDLTLYNEQGNPAYQKKWKDLETYIEKKFEQDQWIETTRTWNGKQFV